jgi:hypothetical protein
MPCRVLLAEAVWPQRLVLRNRFTRILDILSEVVSLSILICTKNCFSQEAKGETGG